MKVLFGINNDDTVKGIAELYEKKYNEKVEYKNVYYFKQFLHELSSGNYDVAVMLEELEKFPTNNFAQIDDYLFKTIDSMTDSFDAKNIVYISSDRRKLGDEFLSKLFNLGLYTTLTGQDRTKGKVCEAIHRPYQKKDVKKYYDNVSGESVYKTGEVSEIEIQRIISYYQNQNGSVEKYNEIFDRIAAQYTDEQLKVIANFLPADVKQHLSFNNKKYQEIVGSTDAPQTVNEPVAIPKEILNKTQDAKAVEIKKESEIVDKIVVKENKEQPKEKPEEKVSQEPKVEIKKEEPVKEKVVFAEPKIIEKEVIKNVFEVPKDYKKIVCFVGAPKVGTTFCINAVGTYLARSKVKTAIVDVTRKRDSYTIYTYDNTGKRNIAAESLRYASNGFDEPLVYDKLSIYTAMPGEDRKGYNVSLIVDTIMEHNNVILMDTDFTTPVDFFRLCQEIYVVQDMNILNINQISIFLRQLKNKGIPLHKVRVVINKHVKCTLTAKEILDGIATYTSYDLKMYDELLNSSTIPYYILPFDMENYRKYIEMVHKYSNKFATFTDDFKQNLLKLINSIYPIGNMITTTNTKVYSGSKSEKKGLFKR
jgi:hypothetical protein